MGKHVCIVGGGLAGISAVKSCVEEGFQPTCFEMRNNIGGLWYYKEDESLYRARVYKSLVTNASKESSCFSDFPFPLEYPPFINSKQFHEYLINYAQHFDLENYFTLNREVVEISYLRNQRNGRIWLVRTRDIVTDELYSEKFDCIIVCVGSFGKPVMPEYEGLHDKFQGQVIHACQYDSPDKYEGKDVLVVGLANSGGDISVDISRKAASTMMSTRSGAWLFSRLIKGLPLDIIASTSRFIKRLNNLIPTRLVNWMLRKDINAAINQENLGIQSIYDPADGRCKFIANDELAGRILSGNVRVRPEIVKFTSNEVHFVDGSKEHVDIVICSTGYTTNFPFISDEILPDNMKELRLYEWMIPYQITDPASFALAGFMPSISGGVTPIFECQTRFIAKVMKGTVKLPSKEGMEERYKKERSKFPSSSTPFVFSPLSGPDYPDRIAKLCDFYPSFWSLLFRDPRLAFAVHFGPFLAYHYRLFGRHQWNHARERILNALENTFYGLRLHR